MGFGIYFFGAIGLLVGKVSADLIFYLFTIIAYELRKKHFN